MTEFQIFSLIAIALGIFLIALMVFIAEQNRRKGYGEGCKAGAHNVWETLSYHMRTGVPFDVTLRGDGGLASVKDERKYIIVQATSYEQLMNQSGTVSFSEEPEKDEEGEPTNILMWVKRQEQLVVCSRIPHDQVPKGLWGKTLCASTSFHGWRDLNLTRAE